MGTFGLPNSIPNSYKGPPVNLVPLRPFPHQPTAIDKKFPVGQFVILQDNPTTGVAGELWYLSKFSAGVPVWVQIAVTPGAPGIDTLTTDDGAPAVEPDSVTGNVNILGGTGIVTSGQGPGDTVTIEVDTSVITTSYAGNSGTATPTLGVLQIVGSSPISTSASGNTVTINVSNATDSAVGVIEIATSAETIAGADTSRAVVPSGLTAKLGTQTSGGVAYGQGSSSAIGWTSAGTSNAVLIGGASPSFSTTATIYANGISFDTGSNTLSNYVSVGSWTPTISGSGGAGATTYTVQSGSYTRIGRLVYAQFDVAWSASTASGDLYVTGFPLNFGGAQSRAPLGTIWVESMPWPADVFYFVGWGGDASTQMTIMGMKDNAVPVALQTNATGTLHGSIAYIT